MQSRCLTKPFVSILSQSFRCGPPSRQRLWYVDMWSWDFISIHKTNVALMLVQRLRRWPSIKTTMALPGYCDGERSDEWGSCRHILSEWSRRARLPLSKQARPRPPCGALSRPGSWPCKAGAARGPRALFSQSPHAPHLQPRYPTPAPSYSTPPSSRSPWRPRAGWYQVCLGQMSNPCLSRGLLMSNYSRPDLIRI